MRRINKRDRTKHGSASVFLALILSALILVECTFVAFVWNLDYALSVNTALKTQIDSILSDYNRQLFEVYGIYAFTKDEIDDECFYKALESNGLESGSTLFVTSRSRFTTDDLKKAINSYYWYRGTGISVKSVVEDYSQLILGLDESGVLAKVGEFMESPAAGYLSDIIKGSETAEEWIGKAGDVLNLEDLLEEAADMDSISADYKEAIKDFDIDIDIDIAEWEALLDTMSDLENVMDQLTDMSDPVMTKLSVAHYCSHNFDCCFSPEGDSSITGTEFKAIHGDKKYDSEYIITGIEGLPGAFVVEYFMSRILIVSNILKDYADEKFRNTMEVLGEIISAIILVVSEGAADIDPRLIAAGLTYFCAVVQSLKDLIMIVQGKSVVIFEYEDTEIITFDYRDFLNLFCLLVPEEDLLERSHEILKRDYGKLYKGVTLEADFRGNRYTLEKSYQLYE